MYTIRKYQRWFYRIVHFAHNLILLRVIELLSFDFHDQLISRKIITLPISVEMRTDSDVESKFLVEEISEPEIYEDSNEDSLTILRVIDNNIEQCINELRESFEKLTDKLVVVQSTQINSNVTKDQVHGHKSDKHDKV